MRSVPRVQRLCLAALAAPLTFASLTACAEGIEPPALTAEVEITSGLTFTFGRADFCAPPNTAESAKPNCQTPIPGGFALVPPPVEVTLAPFAIDVHEVTNEQYLHCVAIGKCEDLGAYNGATEEQRDYFKTDRYANYPVNRVSWNQAQKYCESIGRRLPTEIEWERVARGNPDKGIDRPFAADGIDRLEDCQEQSGEGFAVTFCRGNANFIDVTESTRDFVTEDGQRIYGMLGNAAEWTDTWALTEMGCKDEPPCAQERDCAPTDTVCVNQSKNCDACGPDDCYYMCQGQSLQTIVCTPYTPAEQPVAAAVVEPDGGSQKIVRGGGVRTTDDIACRLRSSRPNDKKGLFALATTSTDQGIGFRCARTL